MTIEEKLAALTKQVEELSKGGRSEKLFDTSPIQRPSIIGLTKVYESDVPLYEYMAGQAMPVVAVGLQRTYKVIDDLGPVFEVEGQNGAITDTERAAGTCSNKIDINFCQTDYKAFRVSVEACIDDAADLDVPFVTGRDAMPVEAGVSTVGDYRDVKLGEAMRQAKDFLLAQGLGNANQEPESLETLINQNTTPNIVDNVGQSVFEFAIMAVLAKIGLTTHANSYIRQDGSVVLMVHPLLEWTMYRRASLPGMEAFYTITNGVVNFLGIPVMADRNIYIDTDTWMTSIFVLKSNMTGVVEQYDVDKEILINEAITPDNCQDDCKRLVNYLTGIARGVSTMGRVINVRPMLVNTVVSGLTGEVNSPNAGTRLGAV